MSTELASPEPKQEQTELTTIERTWGGVAYRPLLDIVETTDELVLYADVPGVTAENLDIQFENRELRIHGKVCPRQNVDVLRGEYGIGDFYRSFSIGESIDSEKISADLQDGVLTLRLPKTEAVKPRRIEVKAQ